MIKQFDRKTCKMLSVEIEEALQSIAKKYGISIKRGNGSYSESRCLIKVECATIGEDGFARTQAETDFPMFCTMFGLKPEHLGKEISIRGRVFTICGLKPNRTKLPILARAVGGKVYKFPERTVQRALGIAAAQEDGS